MKLTHRQAEVLVSLVDGDRLVLDGLCAPKAHFKDGPLVTIHMKTFMALQREGLIEKVAESYGGLVTEWAATDKARASVDRRIAA
jgi:hypothetical protein